MVRGLITVVAFAALVLAAPSAAQQPVESIHPPRHFSPWPALGTGQSQPEIQASLMLGPELQRGQSARAMLAEHRRLQAALAALQSQRKGTVDVYVVAIALDSDPVFAREAREAGKVLSRRYGAGGRTIVLAGPDGRNAGLPKGSLTALTLTLARIGELIDPSEDVLVLYATSHGTTSGMAYHDGDTGYGLLAPSRLGMVLAELGIERRVLLLSACFSGVFVPYVAGPDTAIVTAAAAERTSFGCLAENDWTFFGDALVNTALRKPQPFAAAVSEAAVLIAGWEASQRFEPSLPQVRIGANAAGWLAKLEARMPREASAPVGQPALAGIVNGPMTAGGR